MLRPSLEEFGRKDLGFAETSRELKEFGPSNGMYDDAGEERFEVLILVVLGHFMDVVPTGETAFLLAAITFKKCF